MNKGLTILVFKSLLTSIIIFGYLNTLFAQTPSDSLKLIWTDVNKSDSLRFKSLSNYYFTNTYSQPDSIISLTKYHYNIAKQKNSTKEMATALNERSYAYYIKGDLNKATEILYKSIELWKLINEPKNLAVIQSNLGDIFLEQKKYLEAFTSFNESLKFIKKNNLKTSEARLLIHIGEIYLILDELDLAMNYFNEAESICVANDVYRTNKLGIIYLSKANTYLKLKNYKLSIKYAESSIIEFNTTNNSFKKADSYLLLAKSYYQLNDEIKALDFIEKSLDINYELNNNSNIIQNLLLKFNIIYNSNPLIALKGAENILKLINNQTSNETKAELYELLYKCYKHNNQTDLALSIAQPQYDKVPAALQFLAQSEQQNQSLPTQVSALIRPMLPIYQCTNETIAAALGMHPRTLHRELNKHNTSFVKLKDSTRRSLAAHYLAQNHYSISTISELLGYQEQATLSASVKRWFGYSPRAYRAKKMINLNKHNSKE